MCFLYDSDARCQLCVFLLPDSWDKYEKGKIIIGRQK